ncbi:Flagellar biosynthesis/type III secretory pathway protein [Gilliamella apicola SCGC AB-598-I20]|nr:Flagellar biosynthesis/type III secretory pathway protein [Gilliamella apicola SCGC AB-598-I20]
MYNQTNSSSWKPLHFQDLAITELTPSTNQDKIEELEESEHQPEAEKQEKADDVIDINSPEIVLELENIKQQAREEAYQEGFNVGKQTGYEQGLEIGQQEGREKIEQQLTEEKLKTLDIIKKLADSFQQSINQIDEKIVPKLFDLALIAAQKTIGSLSEVEQRQLMYTIKSLIEQNTVVNPPIVVKVNPKDFVWLEPLIDDKLQQNEWQFIADANIELGGCRIFTQTNEIDASVTTHWQIISDSVHGDEH